MGCAVSRFYKNYDGPYLYGEKQPVIMPISLYQKSLLEDSWPDIEKDAFNFGIGVFERLFLARPDIGPLLPDIKCYQDLVEMRQSQQLYGHPKIIIRILNEALLSVHDADVFYTKMEGVGKVMAKASLDPGNLKAVATAFGEQINETLGKIWNVDVLTAWKDLFSFICKLIDQGYRGAGGVDFHSQVVFCPLASSKLQLPFGGSHQAIEVNLMGCGSSLSAGLFKGNSTRTLKMPISQYQITLLTDSWPDIERNSISFGTGIFEKLFQTYPDIAKLFPDIKSLHDLEAMRRKNRLSGHPLRMLSVLSEAVSSINDAKTFYKKMDNVGSLMAKAGIEDDSLQALTGAVHEQIKDTLGITWNDEVVQAWKDMFNFVIQLLMEAYLHKEGEVSQSHAESYD